MKRKKSRRSDDRYVEGRRQIENTMKKEREEREGSRKMGCSTSVKLLLAIVCLPLSWTWRICVSTRTSRRRQKERRKRKVERPRCLVAKCRAEGKTVMGHRWFYVHVLNARCYPEQITRGTRKLSRHLHEIQHAGIS